MVIVVNINDAFVEEFDTLQEALDFIKNSGYPEWYRIKKRKGSA